MLPPRLKAAMFRLPGMLTCGEFEEFIAAYDAGALTLPQRMTFRAHLVLCLECQRYLRAYRQTVKLGQAVFAHPDEQVPDAMPEDLVQAVLASRREDAAEPD